MSRPQSLQAGVALTPEGESARRRGADELVTGDVLERAVRLRGERLPATRWRYAWMRPDGRIELCDAATNAAIEAVHRQADAPR